MGIPLFGGRNSEPVKRTNTQYVYVDRIIAPNPNPIKFTILKQKVVNGRSILLVKYHGCTTFGGKKLLLLRQKWLGGNSLDPHLLGNFHIVVARFEPNEIGWKMAKECAKLIK
jgi:hypothetical protein